MRQAVGVGRQMPVLVDVSFAIILCRRLDTPIAATENAEDLNRIGVAKSSSHHSSHCEIVERKSDANPNNLPVRVPVVKSSYHRLIRLGNSVVIIPVRNTFGDRTYKDVGSSRLFFSQHPRNFGRELKLNEGQSHKWLTNKCEMRRKAQAEKFARLPQGWAAKFSPQSV